jgi:UDP-N-acetylmuramoyl-L-alanyl-D-glutamate--2,6-diaminopimelate ligase
VEMTVSTIQEKELLARGADSQRDSSSSGVSASASERGRNSSAGAAKTLGSVLAGVDADAPGGSENLKIQHVACDSRKVEPGSLFFALHGAKVDGNAFVRDAVTRGAAAIASEEDAPADLPANIAWVRVREARKALALSAANFFGRPASALKMVAVTGTNGKTTTTSVIDAIVKASGAKTGLFGTIAYHTPRGEYPAPNTTPESVDLQGALAEVRDAGGQYAVMEASSHSLSMDRLWGCHFAAAVLTNLTREHMDYHKTFEEYFAAKLRLFQGTGAGAPDAAIVNIDDAYGKRLASGMAKNAVTYGLEAGAALTTKKFQLTFNGLSFAAQTPKGKVQVASRLVGRINVYNILAAIGAAQALGLSNDVIEAGIQNLQNVSGRFERIDLGQKFFVVVDYAHTDDALENLIRTARELNPKGRVITLFGCGGWKDRTKRPVMGEVAGRLSDLTILSNDNPKAEDPLKIISDVVVGLQKANGKYLIEPDREKAIALAMDEARAGDIVLLAGKGHENYQILADRTIEFDDRKVARRILRQRGYERATGSGSGSSGEGFGT